MRFVPIFFIALAVNCLIHYFVWHSLFKGNRHFRIRTQGLLKRLLLGMAIAAPLSLMMFRLFLQTGLVTTFFITFSGLIFLLASILLGLRVLNFFLEKTVVKNERRREFLAQGLRLSAVAVGGAAAFQGISGALRPPRVNTVKLKLKRWPKGLNGFRVVQISDLHVGPTIQKNYVDAVSQTVEGIRPDLIVLSGDLVDGSVASLASEIDSLFNLRAPHGVFACLGNHEYYSGVFEWMEHMKSKGVRLLRNENEVLNINGEKVAILGVDDWRARSVIPQHGYDLKKTLQGLESDTFKLLMAHQPQGFYQAVAEGVDLQLSGHTHGGQIWPFGAFVKLAQPFVKGLHKVEDSFIYVSCGTGFWGPAIRVGAPSEITVFELNSTLPLG